MNIRTGEIVGWPWWRRIDRDRCGSLADYRTRSPPHNGKPFRQGALSRTLAYAPVRDWLQQRCRGRNYRAIFHGGFRLDGPPVAT